jgi:hypothetical protein
MPKFFIWASRVGVATAEAVLVATPTPASTSGRCCASPSFGRPSGRERGVIFKHVCKLGHEGIVAERRDMVYQGGRSRRWLKIKNPDSPVAKRAEYNSI